jgi:hypothetical protein
MAASAADSFSVSGLEGFLFMLPPRDLELSLQRLLYRALKTMDDIVVNIIGRSDRLESGDLQALRQVLKLILQHDRSETYFRYN